MASNSGLGIGGIIAVAVFAAGGAAAGAAIATAAGASALVGAVGAAALGAAGGAAVGSTVGVGAVVAIDYIANKWKRKYKKETRNWIDKHYKEGSFIKKVLVIGHQWIDDGFCLLLQAKLIVITEDNKGNIEESVATNNMKMTPQEAEAQGLLTKNGDIKHTPQEALNSKEILAMKNGV